MSPEEWLRQKWDREVGNGPPISNPRGTQLDVSCYRRLMELIPDHDADYCGACRGGTKAGSSRWPEPLMAHDLDVLDELGDSL